MRCYKTLKNTENKAIKGIDESKELPVAEQPQTTSKKVTTNDSK